MWLLEFGMGNCNPENNKSKTIIWEVNNYGENYGEIYRFSGKENLESNGRRAEKM
jgi:hypothetical protein